MVVQLVISRTMKKRGLEIEFGVCKWVPKVDFHTVLSRIYLLDFLSVEL